MNRREVPRYACELDAEVLKPESDSRLDAMVTVLSVKGCCLMGVGLLDPGQKCHVNTEWGGKDWRAEAEVVWANALGHAGCRFVSVSDEAMAIIREILNGLSLQPIQHSDAKPN